MTTATLHLKVQRSRFLHHALAALTAMLPDGFKRNTVAAPSTAAREAAAVRELANSYENRPRLRRRPLCRREPPRVAERLIAA